MDRICAPAPQLAGLEPYDPKYVPADIYLSANENPADVPAEVRAEVERAIADLHFNRYPDPLANGLRDMIAEANGLERGNVLVGNGGDELLFNTALAWGGPGRTFLNMPPTFSVYENNAVLTGTTVVDIPRRAEDDYAIDEAAVLGYLSAGNRVDYTIVTSPNNPTGLCARAGFVEELLSATDALVMVDEAYFEFSRETALPLLKSNKNLVILRTFSKAYALAGVRIGYLLAHPDVIREYIKVRQPYSVDALSQAVASTVFRNRQAFEPGINRIIVERARVIAALRDIPGIKVYPSQSNWVFLKVPDAAQAWQHLYALGILVRDFSKSAGIEGSLRVTVGTPSQNDAFVQALRDFMAQRAV